MPDLKVRAMAWPHIFVTVQANPSAMRCKGFLKAVADGTCKFRCLACSFCSRSDLLVWFNSTVSEGIDAACCLSTCITYLSGGQVLLQEAGSR